MCRGSVSAHRLARELGLGPIPYYTFGLGRTLTLAGIETIDGKDWYRIGAEAILLAQQKDGAWYFGEAADADVLESCWHLLFLARATVPATPGG